MYLFTWNLRGVWKLLPNALQHLARRGDSDHVIATFQEWPPEWPSANEALVNHPLEVTHVLDRVVVLHSRSLTLVSATAHPSHRAVVARFRTPGGSELSYVALHWFSRVSPGGYDVAEERGALAALFRQSLDPLVGESPAVIMGDFNAPQGAAELRSPWCFYAVDAGYRPVPRHETQWSGPKKPWVLLKPQRPEDIGTHFFRYREEWTDIDHVAVTRSLQPQVVRTEVVTEIEGAPLLTSPKRTPVLGLDHLPVACELHYQ